MEEDEDDPASDDADAYRTEGSSGAQGAGNQDLAFQLVQGIEAAVCGETVAIFMSMGNLFRVVPCRKFSLAMKYCSSSC